MREMQRLTQAVIKLPEQVNFNNKFLAFKFRGYTHLIKQMFLYLVFDRIVL